MKRGFLVLLVALLLVPDDASAAWKKRQARRAKAAATTEEKVVTRDPEGPIPGPNVVRERKDQDGEGSVVKPGGPIRAGKPVERHLKKAAAKKFDLRALPAKRPKHRERPEREGPEPNPVLIDGEVPPASPVGATAAVTPKVAATAPPAIMDFDGLDRENWGAGSPSDVNGDVGPEYYIQSVNTSVGVYRKSDGFQEAAFTFDTLMSQGNFGNMCDTDNFGDPVVLYDTFEDRWILTDFAFQLDGGGNVNPPVAYQCFAVSMTGDPVTGGWNFYSIALTDALNDYPKLAIWRDGLYMSANLFGFNAGGAFQGVRAWAFNKAQMYAGAPTVQVVAFNLGTSDFTVVPSNARLQTGTPPAGAPNYFVSTWNYLNALTVYKFHVDWTSVVNSTFTGPDTPIAATSWPNASVANAAQTGTATLLDVLQIRAMVQNQYTNIGGAESLWLPHTVRRANTTGFAAPRWYQVNVTGGAVAANLPQAATWDPDGANVMSRFMPSLAVDRGGNLALGYSTSSSSTIPAIKYAGRLATDPINTFSQTEQQLFAGLASQTGSSRWGDYTSMTLDPDGCTFWYTNQYGNTDQAFNKRWRTRINSFRYPECTMVGAGGTLSGTVTATTGGAAIAGATVQFGARSTTTDISGNYSFLDIPAGTYPSISASFPGYVTATASDIIVIDGGTTDQDFSLDTAPTSGCPADTTQADFANGVVTNVDIATTPGDVVLAAPDVIDQQNATTTNSGFGFNSTAWAGQTFTAALTGDLAKVDLELFCSGCTGTTPDLTVSIRDTTGSPPLPTGADLATATIPGFSSGSGGTYTATFATPAAITAGTQYAIVIRATASPSAGTYAYVCSCTSPNSNPYANGQRVTSADSGGTWTADTTSGGRDLGFAVYVNNGYLAAGNLVSSTKDSNPLGGLTPVWSTLTWTGSTPANTSLQFQVAGSNSPFGPFDFVGPDGTNATFFTASPVALTQFYGLRYLQYEASLASTDNTATPVLNDVTLCYSDIDCSSVVATITPTPTNVCDNSTGNTAIGPGGMTSYDWSITNGTIVGSTTSQSITYTAGASGNVGLTLTVIAPNACQDTQSINVPIVTPATPTITPGGPTTFCTGDSVTLTSSSATGNQWYLDGNPIGGETNQNYVATTAGDYTVVATDTGCSSAPSSATTVTVNPIPSTPIVTPGGPTTFCSGGSVTLTSSSATGNQWYLDGNPIGGETNQSYVATASGDYTVIVTESGCSSAPSAATTVTVNPIPATPTITPAGPTTFCAGGSVTLTSSSATGNQWYLDGNPIGGATNQNYVATTAGDDYTVVVTENGCESAESTPAIVTVNPVPSTPTVTPGGPTTFCAGGSVTLTSSSATGNQWFVDGNPIGGETNQTYVATASGNYTVVVTESGCSSAPSAATTVTVNPIPATPTITPAGPTTFCAGGSVTLTSSSATGNQWYLNGSPIGGETNQNFVATAAGDYTVVVTENGCASAASTAVTVTVNPTPSTPTVTPSGPTSFCTGGSVTLTSSSATGNQWFLSGVAIGSATNQTYVASVAGDYTVVVTASGCESAPSAATTVTINPDPDATITAPANVVTGSTGNTASVANAGAGATYAWTIGNGTITEGTGTATIEFTAGAVGMLTLNVTVTTGAGCTDSDSANVTVDVAPPAVTVTSVTPANGSSLGGTPVTIAGTGFNAGAGVTFGGTAATSVVVVNATQITATTPAHAAGAVNVTVTNSDTTTGTLTNGYTYNQQNFDPNGDSMIDPSDIFYLVAYLFTGGPAPAGAAGMPSGDANGDGTVDPADIFYAVNYLFNSGPAPFARTPSRIATFASEAGASEARLAGQLTLGRASLRNGRWVVPVIVTMDAGSPAPQALSLRVRFEGDVRDVAVRRATAVDPIFEISRDGQDAISYLVAFGDRAPLVLDDGRTAVIAQIELTAADAIRMTIDPELTMLVDGTRKATVANRTLRVSGTAIERAPSAPRQRTQNGQ